MQFHSNISNTTLDQQIALCTGLIGEMGPVGSKRETGLDVLNRRHIMRKVEEMHCFTASFSSDFSFIPAGMVSLEEDEEDEEDWDLSDEEDEEEEGE
jgi:hypothetical protein